MSDSVLTIELGVGATIAPGSQLVFKGGVLSSKNRVTAVAAASVLVSAPSVVVLPTVSLSGAKVCSKPQNSCMRVHVLPLFLAYSNEVRGNSVAFMEANAR
jgi:hypothetical protein